MLLLFANTTILLAVIAIAWIVQSRLRIIQQAATQIQQSHAAIRDLERQIDAKRESLKGLVLAAEQVAAQLPADRQQTNRADSERPLDSLARLAALADPNVLADEQALQRVAASVATLSTSDFQSLFDDDKRALAIVRLHDAGRQPSEIAKQLKIPLGDVELLLSLRSI